MVGKICSARVTEVEGNLTRHQGSAVGFTEGVPQEALQPAQHGSHIIRLQNALQCRLHNPHKNMLKLLVKPPALLPLAHFHEWLLQTRTKWTQSFQYCTCMSPSIPSIHAHAVVMPRGLCACKGLGHTCSWPMEATSSRRAGKGTMH